jgi:putative transcriptional regulator
MKSLKGHLLVASPELIAPFFIRTIILMLEHNEDGALGVVLNRPTEATISDISEQVFDERFEWDKPIHLGGPVPGPLLAIHSVEDLADQQVFSGIFSTAEASKVQQIIRQKTEPCLVIANYAGWGPGQLEGEIEEDSWRSTPAKVEHVFWEGMEDLWVAIRKQIGALDLSEILHIRNVPPNPNLN